MAVTPQGLVTVNEGGTPILRPGFRCPFETAGAYRLVGGVPHVVREDFFQRTDGHLIEPLRDALLPFWRRVAGEVRSIRSDWLIFAQLDAFSAMTGGRFPPGMPERSVNASHWYDFVTLMTKTFMYPVAIDPFTGRTLSGHDEIEAHYAAQLRRVKLAADSIAGGAPTLIGEFGIPFDLDGGSAYEAWAQGARSPVLWSQHVTALDLMYNALDRHLLSATQWNYSASNRNDAACADGWNQEDLSIFSRDQQDQPSDPNSGGRAIEGFVRPYVRACQGVLTSMAFDRTTGDFRFAFDANPAVTAPTEVYLPPVQYPDDVVIDAPELAIHRSAVAPTVSFLAARPGPHTVRIRRR